VAYVRAVDLAGSNGLSNEKRLIKNLLNNYENVGIVGRPVRNTSETITVHFGLALIPIMCVGFDVQPSMLVGF